MTVDREAALQARQAFVAAVAILAAPADAQIAWLAGLGTRPSADELALEFDDWYQLLDQLQGIGVVSSSAVALSEDLSAVLTQLNNEQWDESALTGPTWTLVRHAAGLALVELLRSAPEPRSVFVQAAS